MYGPNPKPKTPKAYHLQKGFLCCEHGHALRVIGSPVPGTRPDSQRCFGGLEGLGFRGLRFPRPCNQSPENLSSEPFRTKTLQRFRVLGHAGVGTGGPCQMLALPLPKKAV